jgi:hypothetical protein
VLETGRGGGGIEEDGVWSLEPLGVPPLLRSARGPVGTFFRPSRRRSSPGGGGGAGLPRPSRSRRL